MLLFSCFASAFDCSGKNTFLVQVMSCNKPVLFRNPCFQKCDKFLGGFAGLPILLLFKCASLKTLFLLWLHIILEKQIIWIKRAILDEKVLAHGDAKVLAQFGVQTKIILGQNLHVNRLASLGPKENLPPMFRENNEKIGQNLLVEIAKIGPEPNLTTDICMWYYTNYK